MMTKVKSQYICNVCGSITGKWSGKCFNCNSYNTILEEILGADRNLGRVLTTYSLDSDIQNVERVTTPISELNRILGGGLVQGSTILIGGDPGIGKSTLLLHLVTSLSSLKCLYVTGEESIEQIKLRSQRLNLGKNSTMLLSSTNLEDIISTSKELNKLGLIAIDSIQTTFSNKISSTPGSISQVRFVSQELISYAKQNNIILILIGHVTKDGQLAGPKVLEHMVDSVLYFESDQNYYLRILRAIKNRFGSVNEIGVFEMTNCGLTEVKNSSELFITQRSEEIIGASIFATIEGTRPFLIEIQVLLSYSNMPMPRRSVVGWDSNRLAMIIAVLGTQCNLTLANYDVYLTVAGGFKISEPAADLAVAAALSSAALNKPLPLDSIFFGEVSLSGEIRQVNQVDLRISEAQRLGFKKIVSTATQKTTEGILAVKSLKELKQLILEKFSQ